MENVLTVLLAGGAGERLHPLTRNRAKPAVPFGGIYRIIDFSLSNCINSHCFRILVLVQYKSNSLARHIRQGWSMFHAERGEFIEVIPPQMRVNDSWYLGTADAIYQNLYSIEQHDPREVLILSGDHIYKMDYQKMVHRHREMEADVTIAAIEVPIEEGSRFGILEVDSSGKIIGFQEKPSQPRPIPGNPDKALASMGIYVFNADVLKRCVHDDHGNGTAHDFGKDILPQMVETHDVFAYRFEDENKKAAQYWRDVGTMDSYYDSNMDLISVDPQFNLYDPSWPVRTAVPILPPAKFVFGDIGKRAGVAIDSLVSPGSIVSGGTVARSILGPRVRVNSYASVEDSILFEGVHVGRHSRLRRVIVEKNVHLPDHTVIGFDPEDDARSYRVTPQGVVVVESLRSQLAMPNKAPAS